jgi:hypothetical protein
MWSYTSIPTYVFVRVVLNRLNTRIIFQFCFSSLKHAYNIGGTVENGVFFGSAPRLYNEDPRAAEVIIERES